jgi:formamidopyrimidine-DNA glycosylase
MPELPEVETFVRRLQPASGATIVAADVLDAKLRLNASVLAGAFITSIERRGKHIVFDLGAAGRLVIHLRMSGRLRFERTEAEIPYTRLILHLDSGEAVYFVNPRRLGTAVLCRDGFGGDLGVEPLSEAFTPEALAGIAAASRAPIKHLLLDQRKIAGIGNIYAAEALWRAKLDPRRTARSLEGDELSALHEAIVSLLSEAIDQLGTTLGTSVSDYKPTGETTGEFQNLLSVYARESKPCARCDDTIERIVQAGRSTYLCPSCQR